MSLRCVFFATLVLAAGFFGAPAYAGMLYVASFGNDANNCLKPTPCASLDTAVAVAAPHDTIVCLETVMSFLLKINKSIHIDCSSARHIVRDGSADNPLISLNLPLTSNHT